MTNDPVLLESYRPRKAFSLEGINYQIDVPDDVLLYLFAGIAAYTEKVRLHDNLAFKTSSAILRGSSKVSHERPTSADHFRRLHVLRCELSAEPRYCDR